MAVRQWRATLDQDRGSEPYQHKIHKSHVGRCWVLLEFAGLNRQFMEELDNGFNILKIYSNNVFFIVGPFHCLYLFNVFFGAPQKEDRKKRFNHFCLFVYFFGRFF